MQSIFSLLWKRKEIPEDFRTEILCWVLRSLNAHSMLEDFLGKVGLQVHLNKPTITTQSTAQIGRFDITIIDHDNLIIFENKWDSKTSIDQLVKYDNYLNSCGKKICALIHVTKDYRKINTKFKSQFIKISWSKIYELLLEYKSNEVVQEFITFLEDEGIAMNRVTWEIIAGSKAVYSLTRIIVRACEELNLNHKWVNASSDYTAQCIQDKLYVYFLLKDAKLYFCVYNNKPSEDFSTTIWEKDHGLFFDFDKECFFHRSLEGQIEVMKNYISNLLNLIEKAQQVGAADA